MKLRYLAALTLGCGLLLPASSAHAQDDLHTLQRDFLAPPASAKPMMRWWWFGPAVVKPELARELDDMHAAGIGGVELAAEYPLTLDDPAKNLLNLRYGSPEYVAMVRFAADHASTLGMRVDLTLGSGWPFGGPEIPLSLAAGRLRVVTVALPAGADALPKLAAGETFIAAFLADGTPQHYDASHARRLPDTSLPAQLANAEANTPQVELFFLSSHTRQQVKRAAFGGEGYVLDHMARPAIEQHLHVVGDALLQAFPQQPPYAIFSDSLEAYGSDWTPDLPREFQQRRGYDLIAHLPELAQGDTPAAEAVRHDWGVTLSELVRDNYLSPVATYAAAHGTRFRSQTYGEPAVTLFDEHVPQLPEGEGPQWRAFSFTRWASSANHVFGNPVTSAETWTWLHSPAFRATPLDIKVEADRMFLQGVNQLIGHGFPYSAPGVTEPGWSLYAAAALNEHNPWWPVMPAVSTYLTRISWALRQGQPANDVAILLPEADAQAAFRPGHVSVTEEMAKRIAPALMEAILDAGYNPDFIDPASAQARGLHYPLVLVPPTARMSLATLRLLANYAAHGGKLLFVGQTPSQAPGLQDAGDQSAIATQAGNLVAAATHVDSTDTLAAALHKLLAPDVQLGDAAGKLGFLHRHLPNADIYFLANTSNEPLEWHLNTRAQRAAAEWWDPETGARTAATPGSSIRFAPYASRLLILHDGPSSATPTHAPQDGQSTPPAVNLGAWTMSFPGSAGSPPQPTQANAPSTLWTDTPATRFYSGEVRYTTNFDLQPDQAQAHPELTFAPATPVPDTQPANKPGIRAWLDAPIHEAALVLVNGKQVGALWHPPYRLDLSTATHAGRNTLELRVFNTAINELAGQPPRDYTALNARFGDRFQMQDMANLQPVPSGIVGPVQLTFTSPADPSGPSKARRTATPGKHR